MQAIVTKFTGPTNSRGSRIVAKCDAGKITVSWNYALGIDENHIAAAAALIKKLDWAPASFTSGSITAGTHAHVWISDFKNDIWTVTK